MSDKTNNGSYAIAAAIITAVNAMRSDTQWTGRHLEDAWAVNYTEMKKHAER